MPDADKLASLDSLNEIPESVIAAARRLQPERSVISFIAAYLREDQERWIPAFVHAVVHGNVAPAEWKRNRFLVPDVSFVDHVTLPRMQLLGAIGIGPELRVVPSLSAWVSGTAWIGSPLRADRDVDYRTPMPKAVVNLGSPETEPIGEVGVAVRRWIAARIARITHARLGMNFTNAAEVAGQEAPVSSWSNDARIALAALVRESQLFYADHPDPPGFRGPDDWFRG